MKNSAYIKEFRNTFSDLKKVTAKIKKAGDPISFEVPRQNPIWMMKRRFMDGIVGAFDSQKARAIERFEKFIDKYGDYSRHLLGIPGIAIGETVVQVKDAPQFVIGTVTVSTPFMQVVESIPVSGVMILVVRAEPDYKPEIVLNVCIGNPDEFPKWHHLIVPLPLTGKPEELQERYRRQLDQAIRKYKTLKASTTK